MTSYPRESIEFQAVSVTINGETATEGISIALTQNADRPTVYTPAIVLDGKTGFMVQNLEPGTHRVWVKVTSTPETPVINCGNINIS